MQSPAHCVLRLGINLENLQDFWHAKTMLNPVAPRMYEVYN